MFSNFFLKFAVVLLCLFLSSLSISAQTRIAILGDIERNRAEIDCLAERLSKEPGIILVERSEIDKIVAEQKLSILSDEAAAVKLGAMLGAQGVIVIKSFKWEGKDILSARLVATESGAILGVWTQDTPSTEAFHFADAVKFEFTPLFSKLRLDRSEMTALSILDIRAATASPETKELERKITLLLSQRLMYEKSFVVLERWRLSGIAWEKELNLDANPFWTGSYILDGSVESLHDGKGTVKVTLRLRKPGNKAPVLMEISGSTLDLKGFVESMIAPLSAELGIKCMADTKSVWDMKKEAGFYFSEAQWLLRAGSFERAREASDAAATLGKKGTEIYFTRIKSYLGELGYAREEERKQDKQRIRKNIGMQTSVRQDNSKSVITLVEDIDKLAQVLDIYLEFVKTDPQSLPGHFYGERDWRQLGSDLMRASFDLLSRVTRKANAFNEINRENKLQEKIDIVRGMIRKAAAATMDKGDNSATMEAFYATYISLLCNLIFDNPDELRMEYERILTRSFPLQPEMHYRILMEMGRKARTQRIQLFTINGRRPQEGRTFLKTSDIFAKIVSSLEASAATGKQIDALFLAGINASPEKISDILWKHREQIINGSGRTGDCPEPLLYSDACPREIIVKLLLYAFARDRVILGYPVNMLLDRLINQNKMKGGDEAVNNKVVQACCDYYRRKKKLQDIVKITSHNDLVKAKIAKMSDYRHPKEKQGSEANPVLRPALSFSMTEYFPREPGLKFALENTSFKNDCLQVSGYFSEGNRFQVKDTAYLFCYKENNPGPYFIAATSPSPVTVPPSAHKSYPFQGVHAGAMLKAGDNVFYAAHDGTVQVLGKNGEWKTLKDTGFKKVTAMTFAGDMLYIAYGYIYNRSNSGGNTLPSAIVRIDVKNGDMTLLASSRRNPPESPLDNSPPWYTADLASSANGTLSARIITCDKLYNAGNSRPFYSNAYQFDAARKKWKHSYHRDVNGVHADYGCRGNLHGMSWTNKQYAVFSVKTGQLKKVDFSPLGEFHHNEDLDSLYNNYRLSVITNENGSSLLRIFQLDENFFEIRALGMDDRKLSGSKFIIEPGTFSKDCKFMRGFAASDKFAYIVLGSAQEATLSSACVIAFELASILKPMEAVKEEKKETPTELNVYEALSIQTSSLKQGLNFSFYKGVWHLGMPDLLLMTPASTAITGNMKVPGLKWNEHAAFSFRGYFKAEKEGKYSFHISGRSSCVVHIDENPPCFIPRSYEKSAHVADEMFLKPGFHSIRVDIWTDTPEEKLEVTVKTPGDEKFRSAEGLVFTTP